MTPRGTRTFLICSPEGTLHSRVTSPTGSGRSATCSTPSAMSAIRSRVRVSLSTIAKDIPDAFASFTSSLFTSSSRSSPCLIAFATARSISFFRSALAPAKAYCASWAALHTFSTSSVALISHLFIFTLLLPLRKVRRYDRRSERRRCLRACRAGGGSSLPPRRRA